MKSVLCGILICLSVLAVSCFIERSSGASMLLIDGILLGLIKGRNVSPVASPPTHRERESLKARGRDPVRRRQGP
ncbi:MAG: hypothetical protein NT047_16835 [Deltaproteobacteria bacterium]|nr:hypothetical protein [Deltaproteobacteria bacterium]